MRQLSADLSRRLDEGDAIAVMLVDAGGDGEDVRVEDDVFGREARLLDQQLVRAAADRHFPLERVSLTLFVEGHDDDRGAIGAHQPRLAQEGLFALLHRDRVDQRLALHAFQSRLDHGEFRRIDHHRHARDVGLGGDQIEEFDHHRRGVDQPLVHVDVDDLRAALDLIARHRERGRIVA